MVAATLKLPCCTETARCYGVGFGVLPWGPRPRSACCRKLLDIVSSRLHGDVGCLVWSCSLLYSKVCFSGLTCAELITDAELSCMHCQLDNV